MSYQIGFDGAATAEVQHLLRAVEDQLRWGVRGAQAQVQTDAPASGSASVVKCVPGEICPATKIPQDPYVIIVAVVVGLGIGLIIGYALGRRSVKST